MVTWMWMLVWLQQPLTLGGGGAEGFAYENFQKAHAVWQRAVSAHGLATLASGSQTWISSKQELTLSLEGHYREPWMRREITATLQRQLRQDGQGFVLVTEQERGGEVLREDVAFSQSQVSVREFGSTNFQKVGAEDERFEDWHREARWRDPLVILTRIATRLPSLQFLGETGNSTDPGGKPMTVVSYVEDQGTACKVYFDRETYLVQRLEVAYHHEGFGDQIELFCFLDYRQIHQLWMPFEVQERRYEGTSGLLTSTKVQHVEVHHRTPKELQQVQDEQLDSKPTALVWLDLGEGVASVTFEGEEGRSYVVAFADFSLVITATQSSTASERLLQMIQERLPEQPVKYAALSHFHPHYSWGLRPFIARGISILTTPHTQVYLERLANNAHLFKADALQLQPKAPVLEKVIDKKSLRDQTQHLEIFDIGEASNHTPEYLIFYLPKLKLVIQGDLLWVRRDGTTYRGGPRAKGLWEFIQTQGLEVETIATAGDYKDYISWIPMGLFSDLAKGENSLLKRISQH